MADAANELLELDIPGANCPYCLNEAVEELRGMDGVIGVRSSISDECVRVTHRGADVDELVRTLHHRVHGAGWSSNEAQMLPVDPAPAEGGCRHDRG